MSYVCDLQIISKYKEASIGYKCNFRNEKMIDEPIPYQHNGGTKVIIRSLFQNLEARRSSMSSNEEKKKIYRLVSHFALHNYNIKFVL